MTLEDAIRKQNYVIVYLKRLAYDHPDARNIYLGHAENVRNFLLKEVKE